MNSAAILFAVLAVFTAGVSAETLHAIAVLTGPTAGGNVTFSQTNGGEVIVEGVILGLTFGKYGFHVHEKGDLSGGCLSTGGHFNPDGKVHGAPEDEERHAGDLGNLEFDGDRIGRVYKTDKKISLSGPHSIIGRAVVLHAGEDDLGRGNHPDSRKTGNAGGRVACGVIGIV